VEGKVSQRLVVKRDKCREYNVFQSKNDTGALKKISIKPIALVFDNL